MVHLNAPDEGGCAEVECDPDVAIRAQRIGASRAEHRVCPPFPRAVRGGFPADKRRDAHTRLRLRARGPWGRGAESLLMSQEGSIHLEAWRLVWLQVQRVLRDPNREHGADDYERRSKSRLSTRQPLIKQGRGTGLNPLSLTRAAIADEVARRDGRRHKRRREGASFITRCRRQEPSGVNVPL